MPADRPSTHDHGGWSARAKLNLYLHIVGRRADGFHLLESLVAFAGVGDAITVSAAPDLTLNVEGPFSGALSGTPSADNLVIRAGNALRAWAAERGVPAGGAALTLDKHLPIASGIGGGSADAAAALHALAKFWALDVSVDQLKALAQKLGSDIPACVEGKPVLMRGVGEILDPVPPLPAAPIVLVNPGIALATPPVYKAFAASGALNTSPRPAPKGPFATTQELVAALGTTSNDLEPAAISLCPAIGDCLAALRAKGALFARMSGSGATCFGIFASESAAEQAAAALFNTQQGWWVAASALAAN